MGPIIMMLFALLCLVEGGRDLKIYVQMDFAVFANGSDTIHELKDKIANVLKSTATMMENSELYKIQKDKLGHFSYYDDQTLDASGIRDQDILYIQEESRRAPRILPPHKNTIHSKRKRKPSRIIGLDRIKELSKRQRTGLKGTIHHRLKHVRITEPSRATGLDSTRKTMRVIGHNRITEPSRVTGFNRTSKASIPAKCLRVRINSMTKFKYISSSNFLDYKTIWYKNEVFANGGFGDVYIGWMVSKEGSDDGKCVAIKIAKTSKFNDDLLHGVEILKQIRGKYVIELYDHGMTENGRRVWIMELGDGGTLFEEFNLTRTVNFDEAELSAIIRQMAEPLREFHQFAMHLDVKPSNFVFVTNENKPVYKLIDFDSAQLIPNRRKGKDIANIFVPVDRRTPITKHYISPEYYNYRIEKKELSSKTDIWSMGVIMMEILENLQRFKHEQIYIDEILCLYSNFSIEDCYESLATNKWLENRCNLNQLWFILTVWNEFPRMALLITHMLDRNPLTRVTAAGIIDYLEGKCRFKDLDRNDGLLNVHLFTDLTFGQLKRQLQTLRPEIIEMESERIGRIVAELNKLASNGKLKKMRKELARKHLKICEHRHVVV